jgi:hypothetical protein
MRASIRLFSALLVAPATPALVTAAPGLLSGASATSVLSIFAVASFVTYAHAVVLGVPAAWLLGRSSPLTLPRVVIAAFLIGALPLCGFTLHQEITMPLGAAYEANGVVIRDDGRLTSAGLRDAVAGVLMAGAFGAATGLVWWLIAKAKLRKPSGSRG